MNHLSKHSHTSKAALRRKRLFNRRNWLVMGTMAACTAVAVPHQADAQTQATAPAASDASAEASSTAQPAPANAAGDMSQNAAMQNAAPIAAAAQNAGATPQSVARHFNIDAGPLDESVKSYERMTGRAVALSMPAEKLASFQTQGVNGVYTDQQALQILLTGTNLVSSADSAGNIMIVERGSESVTVQANISPQISLDRYPMPLLDTPQSITVVSKEIIHDEGATTLRDTLRNAPGISLAAGEGGSQGDNLTLRGFTARNDIFLDGMRDFGSYYRDPFNYEEVEVLEGPSGVTFGRGSTGGVINQESKTPSLHPFTVLEGDLGTDITRRFTADVNQPLPMLGTGAALRLNAMVDAANVAARDVTVNRRYGIAPELAFGLGTPTRLKISYFKFGENDIPDYGIPWYFNTAAPVARHNYYGFKTNNFLHTNVDMVTVKAEHDISDWATLRNKFRYANSERNAQITEPQLNNTTAGLITPATPLDQIQVNRNQIAVYSNESFLWDQLDSTIHAKTFGVKHVVVIGAEGGRETSDPRRPTFSYIDSSSGKALTFNTVPTTNLLRPNEDAAFSGTSALASNVHLAATSYGIYLLDTMDFGKHWELVGGARFDRFNTDEKSIAYPTPTRTVAGGPITQGAATITYPTRLDRKPSWRGALVYKPSANGSIYFDYGTSWDPSAEALSLTVGPAGTGTANLAPETNQSYEAGTKWDLKQSRLSIRADLFRTTEDNAREASPTNSLLYVLAGTQRVDGAELVVTGRVNTRWQVLSSYTYMHSEVVKSQYYPASVGFKLANVPDNLFNLFTTYQIQHRWIVGGGGNYVDVRTASSTAPLDPTTGRIKEVPAYFIFNAMTSYSLGEHVALQANVFNLANRNFIDQIHPGHIVPGSGASALFGVNWKF